MRPDRLCRYARFELGFTIERAALIVNDFFVLAVKCCRILV